jgi:hypothetical protein
MAHAYNPRYSGSRDQEDWDLKSAEANSSQDPISKNPSQKRSGGMAQGVGPEFKPQYRKKKRKRDPVPFRSPGSFGDQLSIHFYHKWGS